MSPQALGWDIHRKFSKVSVMEVSGGKKKGDKSNYWPEIGLIPWYVVLFDKKSIEPFQLYLWERCLPSFPRKENSWNGYET